MSYTNLASVTSATTLSSLTQLYFCLLGRAPSTPERGKILTFLLLFVYLEPDEQGQLTVPIQASRWPDTCDRQNYDLIRAYNFDGRIIPHVDKVEAALCKSIQIPLVISTF